MVEYRGLQRHPFEVYFHKLVYFLLAIFPSAVPLGTEIRSLLTVGIFLLVNLCKFFFRPNEHPRKIIEE